MLTLSWSNLIVGEINETASSTNSHSVTRPAYGVQLGCVENYSPAFSSEVTGPQID